jgi:hypothetical protein
VNLILCPNFSKNTQLKISLNHVFGAEFCADRQHKQATRLLVSCRKYFVKESNKFSFSFFCSHQQAVNIYEDHKN